jgi:hypothetical protein
MMLKKINGYLTQHGLLSVAFILLLAAAGCQQQNAEIAGLSIPIPEKMTKNPDKVFDPIPEFKDGQASYQGNVAPMAIFTFYQNVMAAKGWQPTARFSNGKDRIAYTKGNRILLVGYNQNPDGITVLTLMVGTQDPPK